MTADQIRAMNVSVCRECGRKIARGKPVPLCDKCFEEAKGGEE